MARKTLGSTSVTLLTIVATIVATAAMLWPAVAYVIPESASSSPDPVSISDYKGDFRVDKDGRLTAVETLTTVFPCCRHGIFRFWDVDAPWDSHSRLIPKDIKVTLDGKPEKFELSWQRGRKYRVAKVGDADRTISPGTHVYTISYTVKGALAPMSAGVRQGESGSWASDGDGSVFYWDVVAGGWQMQIDKSTSRVTLPTATDEIKCTYGFDSRGQCKVTGGGTDGIVITTPAIGPRTPVTVRASQNIPTPDQVKLPWTPMYDGVLGQSFPVALLVVLLALLGLVVGRLWEWRTREEPPGYPVSYEPPPGLGPVQSYYVMNERVPPNALISTLLYQAERGLTKLTQVSDKDWLIEGKGGDWNAVDEVTREVGESLGVTTEGSGFDADGTVSAGETLNGVSSKLTSSVKSWAMQGGLLAGHGSETLGRALVVVAAILAGVLIFFHPGGITLWALPFAAFAVGGIGMLRQGVGTRRTPAGRDQWSRSGGFYRLLSTTSAQDRFDFSAHKELYTAYIPFAVAFACADKWAQKYQLSTGETPPQPIWYVGPSTNHGFWGTSSSFAGFESSLRSSIGAYEASQSSSSSGGGGFSGGGGGGGGGGGSW
jgi:hypothetical protein